MLKLILEIVFTVAFAVGCVLSIITGSWLLAVLDGACVVLGLINIYLIWRYRKRKETQDVSEAE